MNRRTLLVAGTALVAGAAGATIGAVVPDDAPARPATSDPVVAAQQSVILLIGDGMDDSMITAARNYAVGAAGRLALDELPSTGAMTTYGLLPGAGPEFRSPTSGASRRGRRTPRTCPARTTRRSWRCTPGSAGVRATSRRPTSPMRRPRPRRPTSTPARARTPPRWPRARARGSRPAAGG
ncbi:hypothetical protein EUA94_09755 [Nocardioides zhouii]|uniref:Alkaline phosphatase n=1 Tax=Nocardioides zhouii TaxID=1168729 RepID=A0A4Q2T3F6_9ACTN|nr:hypothetical protein EUA94_09755 [Nocardioides zhouii]